MTDSPWSQGEEMHEEMRQKAKEILMSHAEDASSLMNVAQGLVKHMQASLVEQGVPPTGIAQVLTATMMLSLLEVNNFLTVKKTGQKVSIQNLREVTESFLNSSREAVEEVLKSSGVRLDP